MPSTLCGVALLIVLLCGGGPLLTDVVLADAAPAEVKKTGRFELRFETSAVQMPVEQIGRRVGDRDKPPTFKIADERFQVFVPDVEKRDGNWGLFVFVSPSPRGMDCPPEWSAVLKKHRILWISADQSGNERAVIDRVRLALEAVAQMKRRYPIDDTRIYIGGLSGGGKVAAICGVAFADVFAGSFPMCGVVFYRNIPTGEPNRYFPAAYPTPADALLNRARGSSRHVLLTGEKDFNRPSTLQFLEEGFRKQKFKHVTLLDVPAMGHTLPPAEWFEKGIAALETIDPTPATRPATGK